LSLWGQHLNPNHTLFGTLGAKHGLLFFFLLVLLLEVTDLRHHSGLVIVLDDEALLRSQHFWVYYFQTSLDLIEIVIGDHSLADIILKCDCPLAEHAIGVKRETIVSWCFLAESVQVFYKAKVSDGWLYH
jgi:hypothetical protein